MYLHELKLAELKGQLLQRGLCPTNNNSDLIERLVQALDSEGHDPDTFEFEIISLDELMIFIETHQKYMERANKTLIIVFGRSALQKLETIIYDVVKRMLVNGELKMENLEREVDKVIRTKVDYLENSVETRLVSVVGQCGQVAELKRKYNWLNALRFPFFDGALSWSVCNVQLKIAAKRSDWIINQQRSEDPIFLKE